MTAVPYKVYVVVDRAGGSGIDAELCARCRFTRRSASGKSLLRPRRPRLDCACARCSVPEQRLWRTVTRRKYQLTRDRVRLQNQLESLLEEAHIKLSSLVSDLLGVSAQRMLKAFRDFLSERHVLLQPAIHVRDTPVCVTEQEPN